MFTPKKHPECKVCNAVVKSRKCMMTFAYNGSEIFNLALFAFLWKIQRNGVVLWGGILRNIFSPTW